MTHLSKITLLLSLFLFASACSNDSSPNTSDVGNSDAGQDTGQPDTNQPDTNQPDTKDNEDENYDSECHYDCFGDFYCKDGNVYKGVHASLPCSEATEENLRICGSEELEGTCEKGCVKNIDYDYNFDDPWNILCNEGRPLPTECTVTLELSNSLITIPKSWPTPIDANTRPLICWTLSQDATHPAPENGWELVVQREDKASEDLESSEWTTTLLPIETRQIHYGNCDLQPTNCTTANDLTPGTYFIHILEPNNTTGPAASLVVEVE